MNAWNRPRRAFTAMAVSLALTAGCGTNPATGEQQFTPFMTQQQEKSVGAEEHPKILERYGGVYEDEALGAYVASIGGRLAANSEMASTQFRFTLLNSPEVNAFALPGGYVYVTRGLLAIAQSEAELAGVLAHEIGHVTGRHSAERYSTAVGASLLGAVLSAVVGNQAVDQLFGIGSQIYLLSYSRDQEYEADVLGVRYLSRTGYDPYAQADFLRNLERESALSQRLNGSGTNRPPEFLSTHPNTPERVVRAIEAAKGAGVPAESRPRLRDRYLNAVDGMIYGDHPDEGLVRGRTFVHPNLRFIFTVPPDFTLVNRPDAVYARGPNDSLVVFDIAKVSRGRQMVDFLVGDWAKGVRLEDVEAITVNGMTGATGRTMARTSAGNMNARLVALRMAPERVARFVILARPETNEAQQTEFQRMTYSFRRISADEAARYRPYRIKIVTVGAGETAASIADRMPFERASLDRFRVLNALSPGDRLRTGERVKIVVD